MRRYVLLDANLVVAYFLPEATRSRQALGRIENLVEAVRKRAVNDVELLLPNVCIPEVFSAFAKYAYGKYNKQVTKTIGTRRYRTARERFREYIHNGAVFHQYELNRYHILATDLIAPIDHRFRIRKRGRFQPMRALDHMIVAMGIVLVRMHGSEAILVLTADNRMADAVRRATRLKLSTASAMRLPDRAEELGYTWEAGIFPSVFNLARVSDKDLRAAFDRWPLPTRSPGGVAPRASPLSRFR